MVEGIEAFGPALLAGGHDQLESVRPRERIPESQ
jgi:hypothetical protein